MKTIGNFNVMYYPECNIDTDGTKYYLLDLSKWDGDKLIKQNYLYISEESSCISCVPNLLNDTSILEQLLYRPKNSKIVFNTTTTF